MSAVHLPPPHRPKPKGRNRPLVEEQTEAKGPVLKKGKIKIGLKRSWVYYIVGLVLAALSIAIYTWQDKIPLSSMEVVWVNDSEDSFLGEEDVMAAMTEGGANALIGLPLKEIDLTVLENNLNSHPTIAHAEVHKNFTGNLTASVELRKAVGRLINNSVGHLYIDANGKKFPTSTQMSAYVPLVRGDFDEGLVDTFSCETVLDAVPVLTHITADEFWTAQISEVIVEQSGELVLLPSIGNTRIEFGYPERIQEKFDNLMDFYKQVIPVRGWDAYRTVSVKYRGQVVGKKR